MNRLLTLLLSLLLLIFLLLAHFAGTFLVRRDQLRHADAILILMGSVPDRVLHASDLYKQGYAGKIILVKEKMSGLEYFEKKGIQFCSSTQECTNAAIQLGVPASSITILPGDANSTIKEAQSLRNYLRLHPATDTIILVSSASHMRRAALIFNKAMANGGLKTVFLTAPSPYSGFDGKSWYTDREAVQIVLAEYLKLFLFLTWEQWKI